MRSILRSVIDVEGTLSQQDLIRNYIYLSSSNLGLMNEEDKDIWNYIQSYAANYSACPSSNTIEDFFTRHNEISTLERLREVIAIKRVYHGSDYENLVNIECKNQKDQEMHVVLKTAAQILTQGMSIKDGRDIKDYQGHRGAMEYILKNADHLLSSDGGGKTKSNIVLDTEDAREEFNRVLAGGSSNLGILTGMVDIDNVCRGIKPGELWIHAAFVGELKTTFALNWVYRAVFLQQHNAYYLSLEMPIDQLRRILYVMHSQHPKFKGQGWPQITYRLIRDGQDIEGNPITEHQKEFYHHIIDDIEQNRGINYGSLIVRSPDEDFTVSRLKADLEMTHQQTPLHLCVVDHFALMTPEKSTRNYYTDLNSIVRGTKRLALTFNNGQRIPIVGLLQINRQGKDDASKNDGVYKMQALADSNEAERSADVITTTYLDTDLRANGSVKFGCLKNRDNPHFAPFTANIDWNTKYLLNVFAPGSDHAVLGANTSEDMASITQQIIGADR